MGPAGERNGCNGMSAWDQSSRYAPAPVFVPCSAWLFAARDQRSGRGSGLGHGLRRGTSEETPAVGGLAALAMGPSHPYGRPPDEASYGRNTRPAIADYAHRLCVGRNVIVLVGGDFRPRHGGRPGAKHFSIRSPRARHTSGPKTPNRWQAGDSCSSTNPMPPRLISASPSRASPAPIPTAPRWIR